MSIKLIVFSFVSCEEHPWLQNHTVIPNIPLGETVRFRLKQFSVMNKFKKKALRVSLNQRGAC